ncbi:MAG: hypothetical protein ACP5HM_14215 [Anaerolineae bacterium]
MEKVWQSGRVLILGLVAVLLVTGMDGYLPRVVPALKRFELPYILFVVLNELLLGLETYLAHSLNGNLRFNEWISVVSGPLMGVLLLGALVIAKRHGKPALWLATTALRGSIVVGALGTYYHVVRTIRPAAPAGERVTLALLVWGAPLLAPISFTLVGLLGLIALSADQAQRGALSTPLVQRLPIDKDRLYFLLASLGVLIATVSSVFDHLRGGFDNPWVWVPTLTGVFGVTVAFVLALIPKPNRVDLTIYAAAMGILLLVGPLGLVLHVLYDLETGNAIIFERFLRGAPLLASMVFANMGLLGLPVLLDPAPK